MKRLEEKGDALYLSGYLEGRERETLAAALKGEIKEIRKVALGLMEGFALRDDFIYSSIGKSNRDPYEALMEEARTNNPVNEQQVLQGVKKYIHPLMVPKL